MNHLSLIPEEKSITIKIDKKMNIIPVSGSRNARIEGTKTIKKDFKITFNSFLNVFFLCSLLNLSNTLARTKIINILTNSLG